MPEQAAMAASDTIYALATGLGTSAIGIVRVSGPGTLHIVQALAGDIPLPRRASLRRLTHDGEILDEALVITFPGGASYTGEPMAEFHCHGGRGVISGILDALGALGGRIAEPGEFTRRALEAGRMDLLAAEGLGDLIAAETSTQRRQALAAMTGGTSARIDSWRANLIEARALIEVTIDWADEEVPEDVTPQVAALLDGVISDMQEEVARAGNAERLRHGFEVAIVGPPNVGKSSLLNAIARREAAIVSDTPGTTRDVLEVRYDLDGLPVTFLDTAGLRVTDDAIEAEGVRRAKARAEAADLRILMRSGDTTVDPDILPENCEVTVWSKSDLFGGPGDFRISARTGQGIDTLLSNISSRLVGRACGAGLLGHRRQLDAVRESVDHLVRCRQNLGPGDIEAQAEELRLAIAALDRLTGRVAMDDMLDVVFSQFCLGK